MRRRRLISTTIVGLTAACCFSAAVSSAQFTSFSSNRSKTLLEGNWQSCREADGVYAERIYDGRAPGIGPFELHMGPYHEFALFRGVQDDHREHQSPDNLLKPYDVQVISNRASQVWDTLGFRLEVRLAGGSSADCESWFVTLASSSQTSSE
jgi:hypothetical protein